MSILFDKLKPIIDKNIYECNKNIYILNSDNDKEITDLILATYSTAKISNPNDDFDKACLILMWLNNTKKSQIIKFINEYLDKKKIIILIVPMDFDFNYIYNHTIANSLDMINWKNNNKIYFIMLKKY